MAPSVLEAKSAAPPSKREPLPRRRLDVVYFALAAFDLMTIALTMLLSNHIMDLYQQSVNRSIVWSARVGELVELAQMTQATNAPGNDVFDTRDVARERARRDAGYLVYARQRDQILHDLQVSDTREIVSRVSARIRTVDQHMDEMMQEADQIFAELELGDEESAGRRMATMDRVYGRVTRSVLDTIVTVQRIEDANLQRQVALASDMRRLEFVIVMLIFGIIVGVTFYGRHIGKVMRATEEAHNEMLAELKIANEGLLQYADNVAHELRSPVNKMMLASEVALTRPRSAEDYHDALESIVEESQRLSSIVGSLLFLARARRTEVDIERARVDVAAELELIKTYFEASAQDGELSLAVNAAPGLALDVDRTLFQRAVSNLVANAISHTPPGGTISLAAEARGGALSISVTDTGEGVSPDDQVRVFDRFYRADKARLSAGGRLGLGLPITKSIMELHGGHVALRSELGQGTTVTLQFPR